MKEASERADEAPPSPSPTSCPPSLRRRPKAISHQTGDVVQRGRDHLRLSVPLEEAGDEPPAIGFGGRAAGDVALGFPLEEASKEGEEIRVAGEPFRCV